VRLVDFGAHRSDPRSCLAGYPDRTSAVCVCRDWRQHPGSFLFLQNVEQRRWTCAYAARGQRPHDERIVIVRHDEKTLPERRGVSLATYFVYASLVKTLTTGGAGVIAFRRHLPTPRTSAAQAADSVAA